MDLSSKSEKMKDYEFPHGYPVGMIVLHKSTTLEKDDVYYLHNFEKDDMIMGSGLPEGKEMASEYCRIANLCWRDAKEYMVKVIEKNLTRIKLEMDL